MFLFPQQIGQATVQTMVDAVVHHLLLAADIAGVPLPDMVDAEAGNLQTTLLCCIVVLFN